MINDKVAIVTGASSGIGEALGIALSEQGAKVVLAGRRWERLGQVAERIRERGGTVLAVKCDVSIRLQAESLVHACVREFGRLDILINNAGSGHLASFEDTTDTMIEQVFGVNVYALWFTIRPALGYMKRQGSGHIINVASLAGKLGFPYNSAYVAAKHACVGLTHALRLELAETGIHATVVCPGGVQTEWASVTEGGSMLPLFSESGPLVKQIARERGIALPPIEGVMSPEAVAGKIVECINTPVAEVYTHWGSREFVVLAAQERERAEQYQLPVVLGERVVYERMKKEKEKKG